MDGVVGRSSWLAQYLHLLAVDMVQAAVARRLIRLPAEWQRAYATPMP